MSLPPRPSCQVCGSRESLSKCAACKVTFYCGKEHQASDRPGHKNACNAIKRARINLEKEEAELRAFPGDFMTPPGATIFEEYAGSFWGIYETRQYMRARNALVETLLKINNYAAVEAALNHVLDMLRLCRSDNMGLRDTVPALFLRLGRDQECYDFVKWWAITNERMDYDWGNMDEPYLDLKDENAFETPGPLAQNYATAHAISVTLLKIRLLFDIQAFKRAAIIGPKVPQEILDNIRKELVGNIVAQRQDIIKGENLDALIEDLQTQISDMYQVVNDSNKYFWPALLRPGTNLTAQPEAYSIGAKEEMQVILKYAYDSWAETPGAIEHVRKHFTG